ncbi:uncharacterized protein LOC106159833 isoform X2 [Lingula anatina]|uniref:Uncharacterized protein LOC106159833 isoform X1 n=1 Tax=Lingula anatina TaxID=7574 RepID=A0A1S3I0B0_LINAN|nr:uncharacterized protein LOC106159833 isoform X1 [Lingula anatina]XP_013391700.1 uncharacterized protein LOC106159833 isoform X2 [Lingula anatina]|eukprot:XP_013391699.1 uncharacterized protein LOC106159833 isoform X1 [Lingula anatina]
MEMLRLLTQKLRSQSLNEVQPFQPQDEDDHDSGTESDTEINELEEIAQNMENSLLSSSSSIFGNGRVGPHPFQFSFTSSHLPARELTQSPLSSNCERRMTNHTPHSLSSSSEFEHNSSEEELSVINNRESHSKRKWSQVRRHSFGDSSGSSDDEVKDLFSKPQPLIFSSSPPKGVTRLTRSPPPKLFLANMTPVQLYTSPRKRHRYTSSNTSEYCDSKESVIQRRPSLDFEKMQQKPLMRKHCAHGLGRARIVKIRTISGNRSPKFNLYDPAIFDFRSISTVYNPLTPVEEPSACAF